MSVVEDLQAARNIIDKGWCQGRNTDGNGSFCIVGAVGVATNSVADIERYRNAIYALVGHTPGDFFLAEYNDDRATTKADVLTVFDKAIADLGGLID